MTLACIWHSAPAYYPTGYGVQTAGFVSRMIDDGYEVVVLTTTQHPGFTWNGITHIPGGPQKYAADGLLEWPKRVKTDILFSLFDIWPLALDIGAQIAKLGTAWAPITPIDHDPIPRDIAERLRHAAYPIAMSPHGFREMQRIGLERATYIPHGVDTHVFRPRPATKGMFRVGDDTFVVGIVATNVEGLDRKGWGPALQAFGRFHAAHPDSIIYVHASATRDDGGYDLISIAESLGFKLHVPDMWTLSAGLPVLKMVELYNSFDVMMLLSRGEGFGVPLIESQACGTPVITTDFTAPSDLVGGGWKVPVVGKRYTPLSSFWADPDVDAAVAALEEAYTLWKAGKLKDEMGLKARNFAKTFDFDVVYKTYMRPFLERVEEELTAAGRTMVPSCDVGGEHVWAKAGALQDGQMLVPCLQRKCTAGLWASSDGLVVLPEAFPISFDGIELDLEDHPSGGIAKTVIAELEDVYGLKSVTLKPGDVAIDIGAHVGVVSIYLAKRWPGIKVYAFEPSQDNYQRLLRNIRSAGLEGIVIAKNVAVTGDGRTVTMRGTPSTSSGGLSMFGGGKEGQYASITLADIFRENGIDRCALLKVDCEGVEYEILYGAADLLSRVDNLSAEFHKGVPDKDPQALAAFCSEKVGPSHIHIGIQSLHIVGDTDGTETAQGDVGVRKEALDDVPVGGISRRQQRAKGGNGRGGGWPGYPSSAKRSHRIRPKSRNGNKGQVPERPLRDGDTEAMGEIIGRAPDAPSGPGVAVEEGKEA